MNIFAHPYLAMFALVIAQPVVYVPLGIGVVIGCFYAWRWASRADRRDVEIKRRRRSF